MMMRLAIPADQQEQEILSQDASLLAGMLQCFARLPFSYAQSPAWY